MKVKVLRIKEKNITNYYFISLELLNSDARFTGFIFRRNGNLFESFKDSEYHSEFTPIPFDDYISEIIRSNRWYLCGKIFAFADAIQ